jgi:putative transposase
VSRRPESCRGRCVNDLTNKTGAWHKRLYNAMLAAMPNVPPRLKQVFQKYDPPLYFVTFNTYHRQQFLARPNLHSAFVAFAQLAPEQGISVGRYVIMPDHVHLFVSNSSEFTLSQWIRLLKRALSLEVSSPPPHWQRGFFDHLIRRRESYAAKWLYVRNNPVRAHLVEDPDEWPYQGEITTLESL